MLILKLLNMFFMPLNYSLCKNLLLTATSVQRRLTSASCIIDGFMCETKKVTRVGHWDMGQSRHSIRRLNAFMEFRSCL